MQSPSSPASSLIQSPLSPYSLFSDVEEVSPSDPFFDTPCPICHFIHPSFADCPSSPPQPSLDVLRSHYSEPIKRSIRDASDLSPCRVKRSRLNLSLSDLFETSASDSD